MAEDARGFGLPPEPAGPSRLSITFQRLGERLTGKPQTVMEAVGQTVQPVIQVGLPDFPDPERPLFMAGLATPITVGQYGAVGIFSTVPIAVFSLTAYAVDGAGAVVESRFLLFSPEPGYDPFAFNINSAFPDVRPVENDGQGATTVYSGTAAVNTTRTGVQLVTSSGNGFEYGFPSPMILPASKLLVVQQAFTALTTQVFFAYREFA